MFEGIYKTFDTTKVVIFNPNSYDVRGNPIIVQKKKIKNENLINNMDIDRQENYDKEKETESEIE